MGGGPPCFRQGFSCLVVLWILPLPSVFGYGAFTRSGWLSQNHSPNFQFTYAVHNPAGYFPRFGLTPFRSPLLRRSNFFLFLRVLRCFSSPGSLPYVMDWRMDDRVLPCRVSPFRNLRVDGYLLLTAAYRSLSRLSSALSAKASTLRPSLLDLYGILHPPAA